MGFIAQDIVNTTQLPNVITFLSSGTYTPTQGMRYCEVKMVGAGGGGGWGFSVAPSSAVYVGSSGNSGAFVHARLTGAQIGTSRVVTIGNGGFGGSTGGQTSLGSLLTANGGLGTASFSNVTIASSPNLFNIIPANNTRATFSITTGLDLGSLLGEVGEAGRIQITNSPYMLVAPGKGADSVLGSGAFGGFTVTTASGGAFNSNSAFANSGAGASGDAVWNNSGVGSTQGTGGSGKMIITEYF